MTETITLNVTQAIIDRSTCGSAEKCALAEAIREAVPEAWGVSVCGGLSFGIDDTLYSVDFDDCPEAEAFVLAFDRGKEYVRPCQIEVTFRVHD